MCPPRRQCLFSGSFRRSRSCYLDCSLMLPGMMTPPMSKMPHFYSSHLLACCSFRPCESHLERHPPLYRSRAQPGKVFADGFLAYVALKGGPRLGERHCRLVLCSERTTFRSVDLCPEYADECSCVADPRFQSPTRKDKQRDQKTPNPFPNKNNRVGTLLGSRHRPETWQCSPARLVSAVARPRLAIFS